VRAAARRARGVGRPLARAQEPDAQQAVGRRLRRVHERVDARATQVLAVDLFARAQIHRTLGNGDRLQVCEPVTAQRRMVLAQVREHAIPDLAIGIGHQHDLVVSKRSAEHRPTGIHHFVSPPRASLPSLR
jgi:hypothetical protein